MNEYKTVNAKYRTAKGDLTAQALKAIQWYSVEHSLKLTASSPFPTIYFKNRDGETVQAKIDEVIDAYKLFKKSTHGRKRAA
jgi:hypothetical protein